MTTTLIHVFLILIIGIALIVLLTAKWKVHAFFALLLACFVVGLGSLLSFSEVITSIKEGFGNIMKSLGVIIVLGTTLGVILEHSGATAVMANYILGKVHRRYSALAMAVTGLIVGLPIFCDSGYIVLSGLNKSLVKKTDIPAVVMSVSLASGLYSVHCLIPPHPGATAVAGALGVDYGRLILFGIAVAIPAMIAGYLWSNYAGKKFVHSTSEEEQDDTDIISVEKPSVIKSFLPIVVPIALLAAKSFLLMESNSLSFTGWQKILATVGDPVIALMIGVLLAFNCKRKWERNTISMLLNDANCATGSSCII